MKFSISYNGDLGLLDELKDYSAVTHVFGSQSSEVTGSGRSTFGMPPITKADIEKAVSKAYENKIKFNYLLNSSCMGNKEFTNSRYKEIVDCFAWLESIGVDMVTIANPYMIDICKSKYPNLKISLSSFSMVESVERAKMYDDLGVDEITVRENINRDLKLLENIQKNVKCDIQVLANQTCLHFCPYQFYHDNVMSHGSQSDEQSNKVFSDYCILKCVSKKFREPVEIIKSGWIRPEDLSVYEAIGIDKFKLTDRGKSTKWLLKVIKSYCERKYEGNLADILNIVQTHNKIHNGSIVDSSKLNEEIKNMRKMVKAFLHLNVSIDNSKLSGFIEHFKGANCRDTSCTLCGYCKRIADKVLSIPNEDMVFKALLQVEEISSNLVNK
ncbi:peptidase U32 [Anaerocolumna cellulosilytica]|uniref:Peptidase U32 n=1 Tax=Anaerocolumna cellulosilytica TaxID=433286 RepID=A0A6S6R771_9FIRM|nr:U32 family peptidase [Anaerocolumna cellulosilytica]MBB5193938.1 collagenase-like PrtC family protease [Anaerocolumna cellulosilytica]BCJ94848.1 peptidase U32 [Anaerocolumna cellulosilytica]